MDVIDKKFSFEGLQFVDVKFEQPNIDGFPDLVVYASEEGRQPIPILVIETKRKVPYRAARFDPWDKNVIAQAERYATWLGAPYFATCNGDILVLFETFKVGVPLPQRRVKDYKFSFDQAFARTILEEVGKFRAGVGKWLPLDDVFVQRLRSLHRFIAPYFHRALIDKLRDDPRFREEYVRWLRSQLFEYSDEMNEKISEQVSYLLMNKIIFYKTLEAKKIHKLPKLEKVEAADAAEFSQRIRQYFDRVISEVDYDAIFERTVFDEIPIPSGLVQTLNDFIDEIGTYNLAKIRSDVLGRVYEGLIPSGERHRLGQYYTPPPIVDLIVELCARSPSDTVLDPGCGSGSFLVKAYHKLQDLKRKVDPFRSGSELHREILNQIYGVDINPFPAQLSSINLAVRNLDVRSENINLVVSDFFKVKPGTFPLPREFDVVITNPPYTRQEEMEYKQQIRDAALTYADGSKIKIDARAGIYAYFFTHSAKFLKNGGRMGYITSNTWLDVGFGEGLKRFFLDHFKILAIIEHDAGVFEEPVVDTCIPIFEKAEGEDLSKVRGENYVKFVRIKKPTDIKNVIDVIETIDYDYEDEKIRLVRIKQKGLKPEEKWGKYLRAPKVYFRIISDLKITKLKNISKVRWGLKTGANSFFILKKDKIKLWGIEKEFFKPIVRSPRDLKGVILHPSHVDTFVLTVQKSKDQLKGKNVLEYIENGEKMEIDKNRTVRARKLWYNVGEREPATIIFPYIIRKRIFFVWNKPKYLAINVFHEIAPERGEDAPLLLGILNSTLTSLIIELHGRLYGRGLLKLETYEVQDLPVLNPTKLSHKERERIENSFLEFSNAQYKSNDELNKTIKELDDAVFDALDLSEDERRQVYEGLRALREMRLRRKEVEVLVETAEEWKPSKKARKKERIPTEPSKRLDYWMRG